ncbi:GNAT family N-acetyltransferase [Aquincola sp. MAHUQ-54]|uniref:GNAT family N-acetyltransferase n=1 Tax=Aquincola agrisoli TaxID=3119538 RepID=A0AAW9QCA0_9BURK
MIEIRPARLPEDLPVVRTLFREYAAGLGVDISFQGFEDELAALPGKYAAPEGRLLLAWRGSEVLGCVALRPLGDGRSEMKRLFVRPAARGLRLGRLLAERICGEARDAGYSHVCLDTLPRLAEAVSLYRSMGFQPTAPYVFNPLEGVLFMALDLRPGSSRQD